MDYKKNCQKCVKDTIKQQVFYDIIDKTNQAVVSLSRYYNRGLCWLWWYTRWIQSQQKGSLPKKPKKQDEVDYNWFISTEKAIISNGTKKVTDIFLEKEIAKFFTLLRCFSCIDQNIPWDDAVLDSQKIFNMKEDLLSVNKSIEFKYRINLDKDLLKKSLKFSRNKKLIKEYVLGALLTESQIKQLLNTKDFIKDGRLIIFESYDSDKYSALYKNGKRYFYFNTVDDNGNDEIQTDSINEVIKLLCKVHSCFLGRKEGDKGVLQLEKYFPLGIKIFTFDKKEEDYPKLNIIFDKISPTIIANKYSSLNVAASIGSLEAVQYFLEKGADADFADEKGNTPLILASKRNDAAIVEKLILAKADPNIPNKEGNTPLLFASYHNHVEIVKILLLARANPNITCRFGWTALELAAKHGYTEIVKELLITRASINICVWNDWLALIAAVIHRHIDVVKLLIKAKFDVNAHNERHKTALMYAAEKADYAIAQLLLKEDVDVNKQDKEGETALMLAATHPLGTGLVLELLKKGADVNLTNSRGETALMCACTANIVKALIAKGAKVNAQRFDGKTALSIRAGMPNSFEVCKELLAQGADPNIEDKAGHTALEGSNFINADVFDGEEKNTIKELLRYGANPKSLKCDNFIALVCIMYTSSLAITKLFFANNKNDLNKKDKEGNCAITFTPFYDGTGLIIKELLATKRVNIDAQDRDGKTCLMSIAEINDAKTLKALLEAGANPNLQDNNGYTALMYAVDNNSLETVSALLSNDKIDVNKSSNAGVTALGLAVLNCNEIIAQQLLNSPKIDVNVTDSFDRTVLMIAAKQGNIKIVNMLLKCRSLGNGINLDLTDEKEKTALMHAVKNNHTQIVRALLSAGANPMPSSIWPDDNTNPLFIAAANGYIEIVKLFLAQKSIDFNCKGTRNMTVLIMAVLRGQLEVVNLLLSKLNIRKTLLEVKAEINGQTALMFAASNGHVEIVKELLKAGANINKQSCTEGLTALMLAAENGHIAVIKLLLSYNSKKHNRLNIGIKNENGKTVLDLAASTEVRKLILKTKS